MLQKVPGYNIIEPVEVSVHNRPSTDDCDGYMAVDPGWLDKQNKLMERLSWFRGSYSRQQAKEDLFTAPPGSFLVRISSQPGHYAISVKMTQTHMESVLILPSWDSRQEADGETLYRLGSNSNTLFAR